MILYDKIKYPHARIFAERVIEIADNLGIDPDWLMLVMYFESGLNPQAKNRYSSATGLIQFVEKTAKALGTSTEALYNMNALDQLVYVEKYFQPYKGKMKSFTDVYLAVFYPSAVGKDDDYVLGGAETDNSYKIANDNPIFDTNKDGQITKSEVTNYITNWAQRVTRSSVNTVIKKAVNYLPLALLFFFVAYKLTK